MSAISWMDDNYNAEDASQDANDGDFEAVPPGEYELEVISAEEKEIDNNKATGLGVNVQFAIRSEKYENRRIFEWFTVVYDPKASGEDAKERAAKVQRIGRGQFGALCVALGISKRPGSYDELVGKFCRAKVGRKKETYRGEEKEKNYVKKYEESAQFANAKRPTEDTNSPWG